MARAEAGALAESQSDLEDGPGGTGLYSDFYDSHCTTGYLLYVAVGNDTGSLKRTRSR